MEKSQEYVEKLRASGLRPTKQRIKICDVLFNRESTFHFSISDLTGLDYNPIFQEWKKTKNVSVNYIITSSKS